MGIYSEILLRPEGEKRDTMERTNKRPRLVIILCLIIAAGVLFWNRSSDQRRRIETHTREVTPRGSLADFEKTTISIFNSAAPSVVYIFTENAVTGFFGTRQVRQGAGSGFLWIGMGMW